MLQITLFDIDNHRTKREKYFHRGGECADMMPREERAKQFMAFEVKGLQEALREREERYTRVERHEISEEQMMINSEIFMKLKRGMTVGMNCYVAFHDVTVTGIVTEINLTFRYLKLGPDKYFFSDIYTIEITDMPKR